MTEPRPDIDRIMDPDAVAIVGASTDERKRGYQAIETLQEEGYEGDVYPVNPEADEILGLTVYPTVSAIPGRVDLALVATPARVVPDVLEECSGTDLAGAVVIAVGFGEASDDGTALEREIVALAHDQGIRLVGPNTSGMINVQRGLNLVGADVVPEGGIALLCQSGNMAISLFTEAATHDGVGFSHYVGVGNEADLRFNEYLPYLESDPDTDAIICYVEGLSDGRAFLEAARDVTPDVPIVALKSGRSDAGKRSASSHTGSLAGDSAIAEAAFEQAGVVCVERADELLAVTDSLASLPAADGPAVGILADGGGHATLAADALAERGLSVPPLTDETKTALRTALPDAASVVNPVDVAGGTDEDQRVFYDCAEAILTDANVDALLLTGLFGGYGIRFADRFSAVEAEVATDLVELVDEHDTPLIVQSAYEGFDTDPLGILRAGGVPVVESLDVASASIEALATYGAHRATRTEKSDFRVPNGSDATPIVAEAATEGTTHLSEFTTKRALEARSLPVTPFELAETPAEAVTAAARIDGPVAMKVVSSEIVHKSDAGGVALDVEGDEAVVATYQELVDAAVEYAPGATIDGVLLSPMRDPSVELIVGVVRDEQFGPMLMVGLGGTFVEVLEDNAFRALPVTEHDARAMLDDLEAQALLDGARGNAPVDREAVVELLRDVATFATDNPSIAELDLNPVFVGEDGVEIGDAVMAIGGTVESTHEGAPVDASGEHDE